MKSLSSATATANNARVATARYVIRIAFDSAETDLHYFTSHSGISLPVGATEYSNRIVRCSSTSQELDLVHNSSTIGRFTFELQDKDRTLSTLFYSKLTAGLGLRGKIVRFYFSYRGLDWTDDMEDYEVITQIIDGVSFENGVYIFTCSDYQRQARKQICIPKVTNLTTDIAKDGTPSTIVVTDTTEFSMVAHGTSYGDAPSSTVGYVKIDDEVFRYTGKTSTTFTGITRARFGSVNADHKAGTNTDTRQNKKVEEYIYIELPAVKMILALYTGLSSTFPSHWHAGIASAWIEQAEWDAIGSDIWDTADDTKGVPARIAGISKIDAKQFVEQELNKLGQCVQVVRGNGKLGLRRLGRIDAQGPSLGVINEDDALTLSALDYDLSAVANVYQVNWNYDDIIQKDYTRHNPIIDQNSADIHGTTPAKVLNLRAVYGNAHTLDTLNYTLGAYRELFAGPPLLLETDLARPQNVLEVGDVHTLDFGNVVDMNTGESLNRSYMATRVAVDWMKGKVSAKWYGSSDYAEPIRLFTDATVLPDSAYGAGLGGTELIAYLAANYAGQYTNSGSVITITSGTVYLPGATTVAGGRYYCWDGADSNYSLVINDGTTLKLGQNAYLWVKDGITCNGTISGKRSGGVGGGLAGASTVSPPTRGTPGYIGNTGGGGTIILNGPRNRTEDSIGPLYTSQPAYSQVDMGASWSEESGYNSNEQHYTRGTNQQMPLLSLAWNGTNFDGIPSDLRPTSGGSGGPALDYTGFDGATNANGGAGGYGGASLVTVSRGFTFGASGTIDLSGEDGAIGDSVSLYVNGLTGEAYGVTGGTGAGGAPGVWVHISDGANVNIPTVVGHVISKNGESPLPTGYGHVGGIYRANNTVLGHGASYVWANETTTGSAALAQIIALRPSTAPVSDVALSVVNAPTSLTLLSDETVLVKQTDGTLVTRIKASWTISASEKVIGQRFEWKLNSSGVWTAFSGLLGPDVAVYYLQDPSIKQGVSYDVRVKAVNRYGYESAYTTVTAHTVTGLSNPPPDCTALTVTRLPDGTRRYTPAYSSRPVDFAGFLFRYQSGTGGTWAGGTAINTVETQHIPFESIEPKPAGTYTFMVKMVDTTGNQSTNMASVEVTALDTRVDSHAFLASNWTERSNPKNFNLYDIAWSGSLFVAVGAQDGTDGYIITSPDGITWTERTNPKNFDLYDIAWSGSLFVAVGAPDGTDAYIITSPNGITWTERSNPKNKSLFGVAWSGSLFVAVGALDGTDGYIITSPDGITWTERSNPKNTNLHGVAWSGSLFVAVGQDEVTDAYIVTSPDGITWTERSNPKNVSLQGIMWSGSLFVAVGLYDGTDGYIITSPDGITWTEQANPKNINLYDAAWSGSLFVAVGDADGNDTYILTSPDAVTWLDRITPKQKALNAIVWSGRQFVAVGQADGTDAFLITSLYFAQ